MEIKFINYKYKDQSLDLNITENKFIGITGDNYNNIIDLISLRGTGRGLITINDEKLTKENLYLHQRKISVVKKDLVVANNINTIEELMRYTIRDNNLIIRDETKKINDSLKIVGLNDSFLKREINTLSESEKKLIQISQCLLSNPEIIILEEPTLYLDKINEKKFIMLMQRLKEQFSRTIIFVSDDSNMLYKYTDEIIITKNNKIVLQGLTDEVYQRVDFLNRNRITIPEAIYITYLAIKRKQVKIDYHRDIRDIIKDIYKHI